jgi:hypothetical protein
MMKGLVQYVVLLGWIVVATPTSALFFRCLFQRAPRCGFLGLSVVVRSGAADSETCVEYCRFLKPPQLQCGACDVTKDIYTIDLDLVGIPPSDKVFFTNAASRWESIIT